MHTVDILDEAIEVARELGYHIRQEWLGGNGGGACEFGGKRWIFIDLGLDVVEQLGQVLEALRQDQNTPQVEISASLQRLLARPNAA